jgi:hypothetical protein
MSFLTIEIPNELKSRYKACYSDIGFYEKDENGNWFKLNGGGGTGDVPYWVKPSQALFEIETKNTKINQEEIEINSGNEGLQLTSNALTFGDVSGNSTLDKESINASNRVKNIAQDMNPLSIDKKMLLYDASTKGLTYGNQPTPTVLPTWVQPTAATFSSGTDSASLESNFFRLNSGTSRTFIDSDNLSFTKNSILNFELRRNAAESDEMQLRWMDSAGNLTSKIGRDSIFGKKLFLQGINGTMVEPGAVTCGDVNSTGGLITTTRYGKLTPNNLYLKNSAGTNEMSLATTYLAFKEDGVTNILRKEGIQAANNLASLPLVSGSTSSYNNVIYDPTTKLYRYTPISTSTPVWAKTNSIDSITAGSVSISAAKGGFGYLDLDNSLNNSRIRLNGPESSLDIQKTTDSVTENASLTITDVQITNKLKALTRISTDANLPSGLSNTIQNDVVYNPVTKNFAYRAIERAAMNDATYNQNANGGGLVALYRNDVPLNPHNVLEPNAIITYSGGETPDMKRFELKNKLLMEFTGCFNVWYCVHFATDVSVEADVGAVKASLCPTERVDTGVTGPAVLYTCLVGADIPKRDNVLVPRGSFAFKLYNPSIADSSTRTTTRILFERVCNDFDALGGVMPTRLARQA